MPNWYDIVIAVLSFLSVPLGWFLVDRLSMRRERFAEWRKLAQNSVSILEDIEKKALCYHTARCRNIQLEEDIIKEIERMEIKMLILSKNLCSIKMDCIINFRRAVTMRNFQSNAFLPQTAESDIYKNIISRTNQIIDCLYSAH